MIRDLGGLEMCKIIRFEDSLISDDSIDIRGLILLNIGKTVYKMNKFIETDVIVDLGDEISVCIEEQDAFQGWRERFCIVLNMADKISVDYGLEKIDVCIKLLNADGWSWTSDTFRTPVWMVDFEELFFDELVEEFEGIEWLIEGFSSVIL